MKYSVQQKILTFFTNQYTIKDETGNIIYFIKSSITIPYKLTIYNDKEEVMLQIKKRYFRAFPRYDINENNKLIAILKAKFSVLQKKFKTISENETINDIIIQGDILGFNFQMTKNDNVVASVGKKFLSVGDKYVVDIQDETNKLIYLAIAIVIDSVHHENRKFYR